MRFIHVFLVLLLVSMLGCAGDTLTGTEAGDAVLTPDAAGPSADPWRDVAEAVPLDRERVHTALAGGDMVLQMGKVDYYPDPDYNLTLKCYDGAGALVPGVELPLRFLVEGWVQHLGRVTGYFGGGSCLVHPDMTLTIEREWRYVGEGGHSIWGTYVVTALPDGSWTSEDVVAGGIGKFAGATGWGRSVGRLDVPTVYSKGLVSAPKDVVPMGFVQDIKGITATGSYTCRDRRGNAGFAGTGRQQESTGLGTYVGAFSQSVVIERCIDDGDILTFYGTWSFTNAHGDGLRGTYAAVVGIAEPWPSETIITGGTGRFEGATGWMNGHIDWDNGQAIADGMIYMPR